MQGIDPDPWVLNDEEDCELKLQSLMELHLKPERDFIDYSIVKKSLVFTDLK